MSLTRIQKYAYLQQTAWKEYQTTPYGHLGHDKESQIDEAYEKATAPKVIDDGPEQSGNDTGPESVPDTKVPESEPVQSDVSAPEAPPVVEEKNEPTV